MDFLNDLCEYYKTTPENALELGTRSIGRRPDLPASPTTQAVTGKTFEDIWEIKKRESVQDIFDFYEDQGAWSAFRQVVRHKDLTQLHMSLLSQTVRPGTTFCEYGCGVAPFSNTLLSCIDDTSLPLTLCISDVKSEHFRFGIWRLKKRIADRGLENVDLVPVEIKVNELPVYPKKIDTLFIFEVLEHVPSPLATLKNIEEQMNSGALLCENFILHEETHNHDGPDLSSARSERGPYYGELVKKFNLVGGPEPFFRPNETRVWQKK